MMIAAEFAAISRVSAGVLTSRQAPECLLRQRKLNPT
jgi:hypothetical protein